MSLATEAGYLYVYSKELVKLNKKLHNLSKKAEKHAHKRDRAGSESKKEKHHRKHAQVSSDVKDLLKRHNLVLRSLRHRYLSFRQALHKEHKVSVKDI